MKRVDEEQWRAREVSRLLALVEVERRYYQEMVAALPMGLAILDKSRALVSANRSFRKILGLTGQDLNKIRLKDLFPGGEIEDRVEEVLETGSAQRDLVIQYVGEDGSLSLRVSIEPFRGWDEEANSEALLIIQHLEARPDVEEGQTARGERALLENVDAVVWEKDPESLGFTLVGGRVEILGFPAEEWTASPEFFPRLIHPDDRDWVLAFYRAAVSTSDSRSCEYRAITAEGHSIWLRDVIRAVRDAEGRVIKLSGITVDINGQKLRDEQLIQGEKMAALGRLAGKVSHDCNNLLMILGGYGEELLDSLPEDHPGRTDVNEILTATERLSSLTAELLSFTRRQPLTPKEFSLNALMESYEPSLRRELGSVIELELRLSPDPGLVHVDWSRVGDSILTLAREACQAMPEGGRLLIETGSVNLADGSTKAGEGLPPGPYSTLSITDSGEALDEETRNRLFEPFFTSRRSGQDLPSVYTVIRDSGGDIRVTSGADSGTQFAIYLPRVDQPQGILERAGKAEAAKARAKPKETVLLAEDEAGIRTLVRKILQKKGYRVLEASDGDDAMRISGEFRETIHLLLTDVMMPGTSGRELADKLKESRADLRVLFVSGYTGEELISDGSLPADSAFIQKPFSLSTLLTRVRELLAR